jgi:hypothetical protein
MKYNAATRNRMRMIAGDMVLKPMVVVSQNYDLAFLSGFAASGRESACAK